ncbi:MAG: hypothetical protein H8E26_13495 [FCB group bacterium]|nr:hypothetical protein [FCB group bacterium]MBL7028809.1 hypothetical protein [Candidatus Neomarinimicrobiota bacterium]MBL7121307.1 hypothetical protein [Candidatus Neomarinimicrobiota bacterium]
MKRLLAILLVGVGINGFALQSDGELIHIAPREAVEGNTLTLDAIYTGDLDDIQSAKVLYRLAGQVGYLEAEMSIGDVKLSGDLPGEIIGAPGIEYVIVVSLMDGGLVAFPISSDPLSDPQFVAVSEASLADVASGGGGENFGQLIILTPDPGTIMSFGDPMIVAVSLFNLDNVDINSVRVTFDNADVTAYSMITTDLITYKPDALSAGKHTIFIEVSNIYGVRLSSTSWSFDVQSQAQQIFHMKVNGNLNVSHRADLINISSANVDTVIAGDSVSVANYTPTSQSVTRVDFSTNVNFDWAKVKLFANITSKEDAGLQPQNRYGMKVRTSWLKYAFGDETPMMNRLALWGKRVRGHNIDARFKYFNLHVVSGQTSRAVTGTASFDTTGSEWKRSGYSFERGLFAIRPSFGSGKNFQLGLFYVHTRDSINTVPLRPDDWDASTFSEEFITDNGTVVVGFGDDTYTLNGESRDIQYFLSGNNPEDNIVVGSDIKLALDDHRFVLEGSAAFSLYNRNIIDGALTRDDLDTYGLLSDSTADDTLGTGSIDLPLATLDDAVSGMGLNFLLTDGKFDPQNLAEYFILNENLTLPIDLDNLDKGNTFKALTTLALHFAAKMNYYGNFIHVDYHHVGPGYKALGSPVLRLDGKGWNGWKITDKVRMLNNMLYLNLGWELYKNNTISQDLETDPRLAQNSYSGGLTLNPGRGLPTVTTNMKYFTRNNNVNDTTHTTQYVGDDTLLIIIDDRELNESLSSNVNITYLVTTGPLDNTVSFNMMRSNMDNIVIGREGLLRTSNLYGLNLKSDWMIPLTTTLSIRNNRNQLYETTDPNHQTNTFNTYRLGAGYRLFGGNLVLRSSLQYMTFESEKYVEEELVSSLKTQTNLQANAQYTFMPITIGSSTVKSRVIGSFEQRKYVSDYTDYSDNTISARLEMTF